jgi:argininosuccinate synthase
MHMRDSLIPKYAQLVYNGFWFAPERETLQALVTESQKYVSGEVRLKLYKGNVIAAGAVRPTACTTKPSPRWKAAEHAYNQDDATGFIRLNALRLKTQASRRLKSEN